MWPVDIRWDGSPLPLNLKLNPASATPTDAERRSHGLCSRFNVGPDGTDRIRILGASDHRSRSTIYIATLNLNLALVLG